jgi:DNA-binding transcriptional ArsR family regulator
MGLEFSDAAALFSHPSRSAMLIGLMDGRALPAGRLAMIANVAPQTASSHLSKLVDGRLLLVEQQGRHRYYRLSSADVAHVVEALLVIAHKGTTPSRLSSVRKPDAAIAYARTCYSHLAGRLAVDIADALQAHGLLVNREDGFAITQRGCEWSERLGIDISVRQMGNPRFARHCLDWTERRHHVAGPLGSAMLKQFRELKWIVPMCDTRAVRVTLEGERKLWELLRVKARNHSC